MTIIVSPHTKGQRFRTLSDRERGRDNDWAVSPDGDPPIFSRLFQRSRTEPQSLDKVAAVDLGSNSFHLIIARVRDGDLQILDREREMVRLAAGLGPDKRLTPEAMERAMACLTRFGELLRDLPPGSVRVVGTNTLRSARNRAELIGPAEQVLGHPVEIIAGVEEARLIYLGVAHSLPDAEGRRLVVDIGGGSTEVILGEGFEPVHMESLHMGCVAFSRRFFADGVISRKRLQKARTAALLEMEPIIAGYQQRGWEEAVGASGTIRAVRKVVQGLGLCDEGIRAAAL